MIRDERQVFWRLERLLSLGYEGTRVLGYERGLKSVAYIYMGYIFDKREMAERGKLDTRKVSRKLDVRERRRKKKRSEIEYR